jgi:hypothetical protein
MPNRNVETIRDLIFYQYAKIIARRAFATALEIYHPFVSAQDKFTIPMA